MLCGLYLVALGPLPLFVNLQAGHDDDLFIVLAQHVSLGHWLGPYGPLTLAKGPLFSVLTGGAMALHLPVPLVLRAVYAGCCWLAVGLALPAKPAWLRWLALALLLADPWMLTRAGSRFSREIVYAPLFLLAMAALVAALQQRERRWLWLGSWSLGLLLITREARAGLLLVALAALVTWIIRVPKRQLLSGLVAMGMAVLLLAAPLVGVQALNFRYYGQAISNEFEEGAFKQFYAKLVGVNIPNLPTKPFVPIRADVIARIVALSEGSQLNQVLRQLDPIWMTYGCRHHPSMCGEYGGGWLMWGLREAMARAQPDADARAFQQQTALLIRDVERLCRSHSRDLACRTRSLGFMPWPPERTEGLPLPMLARVFTRKLAGLAAPSLTGRGPWQSAGLSAAELGRWPERWQRLGMGPLSERRRQAAQRITALAYRMAETARVLVLLLLLWLAWSRRGVAIRRDWLIVLAIAIQLFIFSLIEVTSFPADRYLAIISPLFTLLLVRQLAFGLAAPVLEARR